MTHRRDEAAGPFVVLIASRLEAARPDEGWIADIEARAAVFLEADPGRPGAEYLRLAVRWAETTRKAVEAGNAGGAAMMAAATIQAAWQAEMIEARARWFEPKVAPRVKAADDRSKQMGDFGIKGNEARRKYSNADRERWRRLAADDAELRRLRKASAKQCATKIAEREGLPARAVETIRKVLAT